MQVEELFKIWVASFMIWWKPKLDVRMSVSDPSISVLPLVHQEFDFALKSQRKTIKYGLLSVVWSKFNSKLSKNVFNSSLLWLGDL